MPFHEQIDAVRRYLPTLRADVRRAGADSGVDLRQSRICPALNNLKWMRLQAAWELQAVGEQVLRDLKHAQVLHYSDFFPGDCIEVTLVEGTRPIERFLVVDVSHSARTRSIHYDVWQLTKAGKLFERGGQSTVCPSRYISIRPLKMRLPEETERVADNCRATAKAFIEGCRDKGDLATLVKEVRARRERNRLYG